MADVAEAPPRHDAANDICRWATVFRRTLDTKDDRTLFFDMMPVFFRSASGVKVKLLLCKPVPTKTSPPRLSPFAVRRMSIPSGPIDFGGDAQL